MLFYDYCSVVELEIMDGDYSRSSLSIENCVFHPGIFVAPNVFENFSFYLCEEMSWKVVVKNTC